MRNRFKSASGKTTTQNDVSYSGFSHRYFREMPWVALDYNDNDELKVISVEACFAMQNDCDSYVF